MEKLMETRCTNQNPWNAEKHSQGPVVHEDAELVGSDYFANEFACPNCGIRYEIVKDMLPPMEAPVGA